MKTTLLHIVLALVLSSCSGMEEIQQSEKLRFLFIGNSLTFTNDLPGKVSSLLSLSGVPSEIESIALPNYGLQDHWRNSSTIDRIRDGDWDFVVLQQGPSASEGRPSLLEYSQRFGEIIRESGAAPGLFMVWPSTQRSFDFASVSDSYSMAAEAAKGILFPGGDAWREAWSKDSSLKFYGGDGFHPSPLGTFLVALVVVDKIDHDALNDIPNAVLLSAPQVPTLDETTLDLLRQAAYDTNQRVIL